MALPPWAAFLIDLIQTALGLMGLVQNQTKQAAQENVPFSIDTLVNEYLPIIGDATVGLAAIKAELLIIDAHLATVDSSLAASIALAQTAALPVILPTTPPTGYGGGLAGGDVASIWNYQFPPGSGNIMGDQVNDSAFGAMNSAVVSSVKHPYADYVRYHCDFTDPSLTIPNTSPPQLDPTTILATDATVVDWLNRTDTAGFVWRYFGNLPITTTYATTADEWFICDISDLAFSALKAVAPVAGLGAPVWPGLALVTLGTPVALVNGLVVNMPMHGVLVLLTSVAPSRSFYTFHLDNSYRNIGALSFYNDDNDNEPAQTLGFASAVFCPKTMAEAAGCEFRTTGIISGTVTPWVIT
jgi:hypothetical protein